MDHITLASHPRRNYFLAFCGRYLLVFAASFLFGAVLAKTFLGKYVNDWCHAPFSVQRAFLRSLPLLLIAVGGWSRSSFYYFSRFHSGVFFMWQGIVFTLAQILLGGSCARRWGYASILALIVSTVLQLIAFCARGVTIAEKTKGQGQSIVTYTLRSLSLWGRLLILLLAEELTVSSFF